MTEQNIRPSDNMMLISLFIMLSMVGLLFTIITPPIGSYIILGMYSMMISSMYLTNMRLKR
jgi:membrane-bound ClpP family serine protease